MFGKAFTASVVFVLCSEFAPAGAGGVNQWLGGDGSFQDESQWSLGAVPSPDAHASFNTGLEARTTVTLDGPAMSHRLSVQSSDLRLNLNGHGYSLQPHAGEGGFLSVEEASTLLLANGTLGSGSFPASVHIGQGSELTLEDATIELILSSTNTIDGSLSIGEHSAFEGYSSHLDINGRVLVDGAGALLQQSDFTVGRDAAAPGAHVEIRNGGRLFAEQGVLTIEASAHVLATGGQSTIDIDDGGLGVAGSLEISNGARLTNDNSAVVAVGGTITIADGSSFGSSSLTGGSVAVSGNSQLVVGTQEGSTIVATGAGTHVSIDKASHSAMSLRSGASLDCGSLVDSALTLSQASAELSLLDSSDVSVSDGAALSTEMYLSSASSSMSAVADGARIETVHLDARDGGLFQFAIGSAAAPDPYSIMFSDGGLPMDFLGGDLVVELAANHALTLGDEFRLFETLGAFDGWFASVTLADLDGPYWLELHATDQLVVAGVVPAPAASSLAVLGVLLTKRSRRSARRLA